MTFLESSWNFALIWYGPSKKFDNDENGGKQYYLHYFLDISVAGFNDLVSSGVAGLLLVLPSSSDFPEASRESFLALEDHLLTSEIEIPVYFAKVYHSLIGNKIGRSKLCSHKRGDYCILTRICRPILFL